MTLLLNCQELDKSIGPRSLFEQVSFTISKGDRIGLIGGNGSGKTTLLRLLCGRDEPDSGKVTLGTNTHVGYLPQDDSLNDGDTASGVLLDAIKELPLDETERYSRVQAMLSRAEFEDYDIPVRTLSGGWRKRLAICCALIRESDLLVMDEPTNHLDMEGILWLEKLLSSSFQGSPSAFVMVSHDRLFLENIANRIIELSRLYPGGFLHVDGNYSKFLQRKEQFLEQQLEQESRLGNRLRRETEWLQRGPKARSTKAKYRKDEAMRLRDEFSQIRSRNVSHREITIDFEGTGRKTKKLLEAKNLKSCFGETVLFSGIDLVLSPGVRLGLLGKNGCGKSTLMQTLAAAGKPDIRSAEGSMMKTAEGVKIVYFDQDRRQIDQSLTLKQALSPEGDSILYRGQPIHVVTWAQKFLFRADQLDTPVGNLSGGEQARICIADLMRQPADILLLDEPTNDLDIPSLQVLEESLLEFPGAVVLVTHDRYLLNRVCNRVLGFLGLGRTSYFASFDQWRTDYLEKNEPAKSSPAPTRAKKRKKSGRLSYLDQREYDAMEETILTAEAEEENIIQAMEQEEVASDPARIEEYWQRREALRAEIDRLYQRWDELETKKNSTEQ